MPDRLDTADSAERFDWTRYFQPTKLLRQYLMLEALDNPDERRLTQRRISALSGISASVVNQYLADFEDAQWIERTSLNGRDFQYVLTDRGRDVLREMMVAYVRETFQLFSAGKAQLTEILRAHEREYAIERLVFYSAGEVTEMLLHPLQDTAMELIAIVDDDPGKQGDKLFGYPIVARTALPDYRPDAVMITTFRYREGIRQSLEEIDLAGIDVIDF